MMVLETFLFGKPFPKNISKAGNTSWDSLWNSTSLISCHDIYIRFLLNNTHLSLTQVLPPLRYFLAKVGEVNYGIKQFLTNQSHQALQVRDSLHRILADVMYTPHSTRICLNTINISELPPAHLFVKHMKRGEQWEGKRFLWKLRKVLISTDHSL